MKTLQEEFKEDLAILQNKETIEKSEKSFFLRKADKVLKWLFVGSFIVSGILLYSGYVGIEDGVLGFVNTIVSFTGLSALFLWGVVKLALFLVNKIKR